MRVLDLSIRLSFVFLSRDVADIWRRAGKARAVLSLGNSDDGVRVCGGRRIVGSDPLFAGRWRGKGLGMVSGSRIMALRKRLQISTHSLHLL